METGLYIFKKSYIAIKIERGSSLYSDSYILEGKILSKNKA